MLRLMHNGSGFDRMGPSEPPAIPLKMAAHGSVTTWGTTTPTARPARYGPRHGQIKMGYQTRDPITQVWNVQAAFFFFVGIGSCFA
jgi:hypothetical protein